MVLDVLIDGETHRLELARHGGGWLCRLNGKETALDAVLVRPGVLSLLMDGAVYEVIREITPTGLHFWVDGEGYSAEVYDPRSFRTRRHAAATTDGVQKLVAPMPGKVVRVLVPEKSHVQAGQGVLVVEAMKMQNELKSPKQGVVKRILAAEGAAVNAGDVLAIVE